MYEACNLKLNINSNLGYEKHILEAIYNCYYRLIVLLYKNNHPLTYEKKSEDLRIGLVQPLVLSKLNYADSVYSPRLLACSDR